jgi:acetolactate decarboxylase
LSEERFLDALRVELLRHAALRPERREHLLFQTSTIAALLAGRFDGDVTVAELLGHGDLGLGTLNGCDGELVVLDGRAWQARLDGSLHPVAGDALTPYAVVTRFRPDHQVELSGPLDFDALTARLDSAGRPGSEGAAVRIEGRFATMRVRSVPRQSPPYPPLADVVGQQQVTDLEDVTGTVVGFRFPGPLDGIEIAGWHLHFADAERRRGGHVLACVLDHGTAALDHEADLHVELPPTVEPPHEDPTAGAGLDRLERDRSS